MNPKKYFVEKIDYRLLALAVSGKVKALFNERREYDPNYIREIHRGRRENAKIKKVIKGLLK